MKKLGRPKKKIEIVEVEVKSEGIVEKSLVCECSHNKASHYGPSKNWCNEQNCRCQEFK